MNQLPGRAPELRCSSSRSLAPGLISCGPALADLLDVMQTMQQMKFSPLIDREWAEDGMIENFDATAELGGALGQGLIHLRNLRQNLGQHFLDRQACGPCLRRSFPSPGKIVEAEHDQRLGMAFPSRLRGKRFTAIDDSSQSSERSRVGQVKMLQDFSSRPFAGNVPTQLLGRQTPNRGFDLFAQSLETRVHDGYLPFATFQLECCRTNNRYKLYQEGCHENG